MGRSARPHGARVQLADRGEEHQGQVRPELYASSDAPSSPASLPPVWRQASPIRQQRRSRDNGGPIGDGRRREQWRRHRTLASYVRAHKPRSIGTHNQIRHMA